MMTMRGGWCGLLMLALGAGCVSTPAGRIAKNPELFAGFPPGAQELIRAGDVDVGFTPDMVRMALGAPARVYTRTQASGTVEVWSYVETRYDTEYRPVSSSYWYRDHKGRLREGRDWTWLDVGREYEVERLRVEFTGDVVSAIERVKP